MFLGLFKHPKHWRGVREGYKECGCGWRYGSWRSQHWDPYRVHPPCSDESVYAEWVFDCLEAGDYAVEVEFVGGHDNRSYDVRYEVYDRDVPEGEATIDQRSKAGKASLGVYQIMFGMLKLRMFGSPHGYVISDKVSIRKIY